MSYSSSSPARTRAFARVLGPFLAIVTAVAAYRMPTMAAMFSDFFANGAVVWITGALLLLCGMIIIALHQYWRAPAAVLISLFGWLLVLRGAIVLVAPNLMIRGGEALMPHQTLLRLSFGLFTLIGLYLTYVGWIAKPRDH
ncbi:MULTISPECIES: hypothetical protein [unclassified Beijerinckia]|uniref:hypothetical protein n=1 Tax=unclassified Beijerinckia TaxID=2638183 RepID=UPI00089AB72E|nr:MULTISPECIES: hypothetical protein [unclassified Beijerinckia]MDH7794924.1 hypothetical protein [Beijerinckia sp. GAS462]SEB80597.1 hypothetical protein SAMN05443249_1197 [Beijerinckia sp. 28-YEA-48]